MLNTSIWLFASESPKNIKVDMPPFQDQFIANIAYLHAFQAWKKFSPVSNRKIR